MRQSAFIFLILFIAIIFQAPANAQYSRHESARISPTAFNLQQGEKNISSTILLFNSFSMGIKDNLSFNFNLSGIGGATTTLKYTHSLNDFVHIGILPILGFDLNERDGYIHPKLAGILTIGEPNAFINFSYGRAVDIELVKNYPGPVENLELTNSRYFYSVSGSFRVNEKFSLSLDNYFERDRNLYGFQTIMLRYELKAKHLIQGGFGLFTESYEEHGESRADLFALPLISYSYFWGIKKPTSQYKLI